MVFQRSGSGCSKQDYDNPGLVSTFNPVLEPSDEHFSKSFLPYVLTSKRRVKTSFENSFC